MMTRWTVAPSLNYSDEELLEKIRQAAGHTSYYVADWQRELDRRASERQAAHMTRTAYIATGAALVSAVAALAALIASRS